MDGNCQMISYEVNTSNKIYPKISLSDCIVENIESINNNLKMRFNIFGFWVKKCEELKYNRVKNAELILLNCNFNNSSITIFKPHRFFFRKYQIEGCIGFEELFDKINCGIWKLEIIQEYSNEMGGLFFGKIREKKGFMSCYIHIEYQKKEYRYLE